MADTQISIRLAPEALERVDRIAGHLDRSRNWVIARAVTLYLDTKGRQIEADAAAIASLDRGEGVPIEAVIADLDRIERQQAHGKGKAPRAGASGARGTAVDKRSGGRQAGRAEKSAGRRPKRAAAALGTAARRARQR
jgi:predicted transcriptional regulator